MEHNKAVVLPHLGAQCADTHAHLCMLDDPGGALERATMAGVMLIGTVTDVTESPLATFDALPGWVSEAGRRLHDWAIPHGAPPEVRIIVGCHPHNAKDFDEAAAETLLGLANDPRVAAIGESGLDFHYDYSPRDAQYAVFERHIELAHRLGLPLVVHLRDAYDFGLAMLQSAGLPEAGCVIHCFAADRATVEKFLELGCMISFSGAVTFPKAEDIRAAAAVVPLERLLAETDSPFLAPVPYRGRTNEPAWTTLTVQRIAELKGLPTAEVALATIDNARTLFHVPTGV